MDSTDFEDFMDFFWIFSGFFDEVYGIFGVKCPSNFPTALRSKRRSSRCNFSGCCIPNNPKLSQD